MADPYRTVIIRVEHVHCGYGGSGPAPAWYCAVMPYFDVTAVRAIGALRMTEFVVDDVAHAKGAIELRVWRPGRDSDHNEITVPFSGRMDAGEKLRLRGRAELTPIPAGVDMHGRRYRATLIVDDAHSVELIGFLDAPWPTA